jgi:hypothetical protein
MNPDWRLSASAMANIGLSISFLTTLYALFSYSTMDRIRAYLMLPFKKRDVFYSFVFAQYFTLLLERISFVLVAAALFTKTPFAIISHILLSSLVTVTLAVVLLMSVNRKRYAISVLSLLLIAVMYDIQAYSSGFFMNLAVLLGLLLVSILLLASFDAKHLIINRESKARAVAVSRMNYFFTTLMREKILLVNGLALFAVAGLFAFIARNTPFLLCTLWGAVAMNTPVTTMFSGDKALLRQEQLLPRHSGLMFNVYATFLGVYFGVANAYVILLFYILGRWSIFIALTGIVFTIIETCVALLLERKYPLTLWQKKQEFWRNPRKYILPIIVCGIALTPYLLGLL